ncbi:MAG: hypothetical protein OHK0046_27190 [Anaerolineae bacterium]
MDRAKFDAFAVYCPDDQNVYYLLNRDIPETMDTGVTLRLEPPQNFQVKDIRWARDHMSALRLFE